MDTSTSSALALFQAHGPAVYRFALAILRHQQDAEDVVQETFLKLLRHLHEDGDTRNVRGWLFTVAAHAARDRQRRRRRWIPWAPIHDGRVEPALPADEDGRVHAAREALETLGARDRMLIALRASGLSYRDMAESAGIRPASVGRLLARAMDRWERACRRTHAFAPAPVTSEQVHRQPPATELPPRTETGPAGRQPSSIVQGRIQVP
jgi:RNA polymerase sigma-70 factor (ECF subfamily)